MSAEDTNGPARGSGVKTLAIRLEPDRHASLVIIAGLRGNTITDELRAAVEAHIAAAKTEPDLAAQADTVLDEIERDASARRDAIASLFGGQAKQPDTGSKGGRRTGKAADSSES